ncbi:large ribosomal subunit protein eL21x/eL21w-like [Humulus lupulus]|uniref:large ribosomal subunit protein eL21x/eL21w-like n=1 Tax=Humulus lupulus TaxID=3486 RepID=UPI002B417155|nr:large ribosomal subunit protein eL21x/eL21w-like [Humulus lupulus]
MAKTEIARMTNIFKGAYEQGQTSQTACSRTPGGHQQYPNIIQDPVKFNDTIHKGMPHKFYHGQTRRVWNITKHAIGVEVNKQVGNCIIKKRIHVRVEHVQPSRCTEEFRNRKLRNDKLKAEAKLKGEAISTKRQPEGPKPGFMVEGAQLETVTPIPYDVVNDLKGGY